MADDSKLHIDADWKAQAQKEREKLRQSEQQAQTPQGEPGQGGEGGEGQMPPANFDTLIQTLATNALLERCQADTRRSATRPAGLLRPLSLPQAPAPGQAPTTPLRPSISDRRR